MSNLHLTRSVREGLEVLEKSTVKMFLKASPSWLEVADWIRDRTGHGQNCRKGDRLGGSSITQAWNYKRVGRRTMSQTPWCQISAKDRSRANVQGPPPARSRAGLSQTLTVRWSSGLACSPPCTACPLHVAAERTQQDKRHRAIGKNPIRDAKTGTTGRAPICANSGNQTASLPTIPLNLPQTVNRNSKSKAIRYQRRPQ